MIPAVSILMLLAENFLFPTSNRHLKAANWQFTRSLFRLQLAVKKRRTLNEIIWKKKLFSLSRFNGWVGAWHLKPARYECCLFWRCLTSSKFFFCCDERMKVFWRKFYAICMCGLVIWWILIWFKCWHWNSLTTDLRIKIFCLWLFSFETWLCRDVLKWWSKLKISFLATQIVSYSIIFHEFFFL